MSSLRSDQTYLVNSQYRDGTNLDARIYLHERFGTATENWFRWLFDRLTLPSNAHILELGCGTAGMWKENSDRIPTGWDVTLSDLSPGMLGSARENLPGVDFPLDATHPFAYRVIDAQSNPFDHSSLDGVIAHHMLFHVPDRPRALSEIRRVLKPGARLFASTLGRNNMRELTDAIRAIDPGSGFGAEMSFTLEDGEEQLRTYFDEVRLDLFEGDLEVTELEPLMKYVASSWAWEQMDEDRRRLFAEWARGELEKSGAIHISKYTGMFTAW